MDFSLIVGIIFGLVALIFGFTEDGGNLRTLTSLSPFIIVVGGTIGAVIASFSFGDILHALKSVIASFKQPHSGSTEKLITKISDISSTFRKDGITALDSIIKDSELQKEEYLLLKEGLILIQEMLAPEDIQYVLESDIRAYKHKCLTDISVFEGAAGFSPTMGVIGTVMSLILVLSNGFGNPTELASSIATAFIATLYGVGFANVLYLPMANKLRSMMKRSLIQKELIVDGVCLISKGSLPRTIENELSLYHQAFSDGHKRYRNGIEN